MIFEFSCDKHINHLFFEHFMVMIVGITGTIGAGKGTVVDYLVNEKGFKHYSARAFLYEELDRRGLEHIRDNLISVANDLRAKHGASYVAEELFKRAQEQGGDCVIESLRTVGEIESLRKQENFVLFAVDAPRKIRYDRIIGRGSSTDHVTFEDFSAKEDGEMSSDDPNKQNLSKCIEMADFVFVNDRSIEDLNNEVETYLKANAILMGDDN